MTEVIVGEFEIDLLSSADIHGQSVCARLLVISSGGLPIRRSEKLVAHGVSEERYSELTKEANSLQFPVMRGTAYYLEKQMVLTTK